MNIWYWSPTLVAFFIFFITAGGILLIRLMIEGRVYISRWWTFRFGDGIFLPLYGYFMAQMIQSTPPPALYLQPKWHISCLVLGYLFMFITESLHHKHQTFKRYKSTLPSHFYHSLIFGIIFYLVVSTFPYLSFTSYGPSFALLGYAVCAYKDFVIHRHRPIYN